MRRLLSLCLTLSLPATAMSKEHVIVQKDKKFNQDAIEITAGDSIVFRNEDETAHHLMYKIDGKRESHKQKSGDPDGTAITQAFSAAGDITVRCAIHPKMKLKIKVK